MYQTAHDLPLQTRQQVVDLLNVHLAVAIDLNAQLKQAHWNVRGSHFFSLHELFDKIAEVVEESIDKLAERVMALGGYAKGTIPVVAQTSTLKPYPLDIAEGDDHLMAVANAIAQAAKQTRQGIDATDALGDKVTADILTEITTELDQYLWFIEAHIHVK